MRRYYSIKSNRSFMTTCLVSIIFCGIYITQFPRERVVWRGPAKCWGTSSKSTVNRISSFLITDNWNEVISTSSGAISLLINASIIDQVWQDWSEVEPGGWLTTLHVRPHREQRTRTYLILDQQFGTYILYFEVTCSHVRYLSPIYIEPRWFYV